ncbi:MAG: AbrB/MazE/SpoVT family DNA-binding domain-containing protein [Cyclobacteriaceae bacterium]
MKLKITKIGNSQGVRIPKEFLQGFSEGMEFKLSRKGDSLILSPNPKSRKTWEDQIAKASHDDSNDFIINDFDENDWEWK